MKLWLAEITVTCNCGEGLTAVIDPDKDVDARKEIVCWNCGCRCTVRAQIDGEAICQGQASYEGIAEEA